ncbi:MAG: hypothetical protein BWY76_00944 [bacterium ADurb.Bin429]|nr:MAG: hypothetical protein BWY76_00944 [bacterium ADurb.Bin429]
MYQLGVVVEPGVDVLHGGVAHQTAQRMLQEGQRQAVVADARHGRVPLGLVNVGQRLARRLRQRAQLLGAGDVALLPVIILIPLGVIRDGGKRADGGDGGVAFPRVAAGSFFDNLLAALENGETKKSERRPRRPVKIIRVFIHQFHQPPTARIIPQQRRQPELNRHAIRLAVRPGRLQAFTVRHHGAVLRGSFRHDNGRRVACQCGEGGLGPVLGDSASFAVTTSLSSTFSRGRIKWGLPSQTAILITSGI